MSHDSVNPMSRNLDELYEETEALLARAAAGSDTLTGLRAQVERRLGSATSASRLPSSYTFHPRPPWPQPLPLRCPRVRRGGLAEREDCGSSGVNTARPRERASEDMCQPRESGRTDAESNESGTRVSEG